MRSSLRSIACAAAVVWEREGGILTRHVLEHGRLLGFVATGGLAHGFVAGGQGCDGEEGEEEGEGVGDAPGLEDDAEVVVVPGEDHLRSCLVGHEGEVR